MKSLLITFMLFALGISLGGLLPAGDHRPQLDLATAALDVGLEGEETSFGDEVGPVFQGRVVTVQRAGPHGHPVPAAASETALGNSRVPAFLRHCTLLI